MTVIRRIRGAGRTRLIIAAVITLVALAAVGAFTASLTRTLQSIDRHEAHLVALQQQANDGLARLAPKVAHLRSIRTKAAGVSATLNGVANDLAAENDQVTALDQTLVDIQARLVGVSGRIGALDTRVGGISTQLATLSTNLSSTAGNVARLTGDVDRIAASLARFPTGLKTVNSRLGYVNDTVGGFGRGGVTTRIGLTVYLGGDKQGTATIDAVLIPRGAWK